MSVITHHKNIVFPREVKHFINNKYVDSANKETFDVVNPTTEEVMCKASSGQSADVDLAVEAASAAFPSWSTLNPLARQKIILKLADVLEQNAEQIAVLESFNNGQPVKVAKAMISTFPDQIRYMAGWVGKIDGRVTDVKANYHVYNVKQAIGVCGLILPWNVPLWTLMVKLIPCIGMGNTCIIKPAEQTPLTALRFAELCAEAGVPAGVVNVVLGLGPSAGAPITHHPKIKKVAFTGSTEVGRIIMQAAAKSNLKKVQLELGGKSPLVICEDAEVTHAATIATIALFSNNGQLCTAGSRTYVHEKIYDSFVNKCAEIAKNIKVGDQLLNETDQGPQIDAAQFNKILHYIELGKKEGAKLVCGGKRHGNKGYFIEPTVFADVTDNMTIAKEEIFGPVMSILKFSDISTIIERCNNSEYGLAAGIVTNDPATMFAFSQKIEAGTVWVNTYHEVFPQCEFGGCKQSGFGKEMGKDGIEEWTVTKCVVMALPPSRM